MMTNNLINVVGTSNNALTTILVVLLIVAFIYLAIRVPEMRIFVVIFAILSVYAFGAYATSYNINYMNLTGVTVGEIVDSFVPSTTVDSKETNIWEFDSLGFMASDTEFKHSVIVEELTPAPNVDLANKKYDIYINNDRCQFNESGNNYIKSSFTYEFYNDNNELITTETLEIRFYIYSNHAELEIFTENGSVGVQYWKSFLVKNGFILSIKESTLNNNDLVVDGVGNLEDFENFNSGVVNVNITFEESVILNDVEIILLSNAGEQYIKRATSNEQISFSGLCTGTYEIYFNDSAFDIAYVIENNVKHTRLTFDITDVFTEYNFEVLVE